MSNGPQMIFRLGLIAAAVAAVVIGLNGPAEVERQTVSTSDFDLFIDAAMSDFDANDARTTGAPQQTVVNGWVARDLLFVAANQNEAAADTLDAIAASIQDLSDPASRDERPAHLLALLVVVVAWIGAWNPRLGGLTESSVDHDSQPVVATGEADAPS